MCKEELMKKTEVKEMLKHQRFGVEIEFTGITREKAANIVAKMFGTVASRPIRDGYFTRNVEDNKGRTWKVQRDSSINPVRNDGTVDYPDEYRVELVTPPLNYEDIETLQEIVRVLREAGGKANASCGIHVHVDGANHNCDSLRRLVNIFDARQDLFYEALCIGDRAYHWCKKTDPQLFKAMKAEKNLTNYKAETIWYSSANGGYGGGIDHSHYNSTRYQGLNLHAFFTKGTVEFRLFNGTMHAGKIKAYIQFCLGLSAWAITSNDRIKFNKISHYTPDQKVKIMNGFLTKRLGLSGEEFKTCRHHLLKPLKDAAEAYRHVA